MPKVKNNRSAEYWRRRYKAIEEKMYGISEKTSSEIKAICDSTLANIEKDIAIWYQRFADNNEISYNEALKMIKNKELKELDWDVSEYINKGRENAVTHLWEHELENASAQFHISRLEALKIQLMSHCDNVLGKADKKTESALKEVYSEGYLRTAYEMQKGLDTGFDVAKIDDEMVNTIIHKPWADDGSNFSERIWGKYRPTLVNRLHRTLMDCVIRGENPNNVTEAIAKEFKAGSSAASNLVMTEYAYFTSLSRQDCLKELDVEEFEVVETLDMHTCSTCQDMDGKHFTMDKYEIGVTVPPFHPRCRGTTCPYFDDEFTVDETRAARDPITGKTVSVKDMSYKEWKDEFVKEHGQAEWDYYEKSTKNKKQDREQFERYKAILGENIPETLAEFQRIKYNNSKKWEDIKYYYRGIINGYVIENAVGNFVILSNHSSLKERPNSIVQVTNKKGGITRNYYGANGWQTKQISNHNHGNPEKHPFGKNGEHAHDYIYDEYGNLIDRLARELTEYERKENGDIL